MATTALPTDLADVKLVELVKAVPFGLEQETSRIFAEIIKRFSPLLKRTWKASRVLGADYEDYTQEVFLRVFRSLPKLNDSAAFPGYFRRIAYSTAVDMARRAKNRQRETSASDMEIATEHYFDRDLQQRLILRSYLEYLPAQERRVLELLQSTDLKLSDIAERLEISPGSARATKARALKRIRGVLRDEARRLERDSPDEEV